MVAMDENKPKEKSQNEMNFQLNSTLKSHQDSITDEAQQQSAV